MKVRDRTTKKNPEGNFVEVPVSLKEVADFIDFKIKSENIEEKVGLSFNVVHSLVGKLLDSKGSFSGRVVENLATAVNEKFFRFPVIRERIDLQFSPRDCTSFPFKESGEKLIIED